MFCFVVRMNEMVKRENKMESESGSRAQLSAVAICVGVCFLYLFIFFLITQIISRYNTHSAAAPTVVMPTSFVDDLPLLLYLFSMFFRF